jgi:hypothetical protein
MQSDDPNTTKKQNWFAKRSAGCFILFLGGIAGYISVIRPLIQMLNGEPYVSYSVKMVAMAALAIIFGLVMMIVGGQEFNELTTGSNGKGLSGTGIIVIVLMLVFVGLCVWIWTSAVAWLGYS